LSAYERARESGRCAEGFSVDPLVDPDLNEALGLELLEQSQCGLALIALDGMILFANPIFRKLCHLGSTSLSECYFQQSLTRAGAIFYESQFLPTLLQRGEVKEISLELVSSTGEQTPVFANAVLRRSQDGSPDGMFLSILDSTRRRLYEKELLRARRDAEQLSEVVRRSSDAILRLSPDGVIHTWNRGAQQIFGWSSSEALGKPLTHLFTEHGTNELQDAMGMLSRGTEIFKEIAGWKKDGTNLELSICLTPHLEAPGTLVAFSAIIRDITSRKLAERAMIQSEKLASVGRLASSIAHEINNPLEAVTNLLYILQSRPLDPESLSLLETAQEELARVSQIATHTLRFYRQSSSRTHLDLSALADSVLGLYRARLVNDSKRASPLLCFEGELRQILAILVSNAYDAMKSGGKLTLRNRNATIWPAGVPGVRITVADTGTGIEHAVFLRLFETFFSTKGINGTGLGLWITQELVEKNRGRIKIRSSTKPGRNGTIVTMAFPHRRDEGHPI
jgi:PAS domain S-box-containing protein